MVTLNDDEIKLMRDRIASGRLPPTAIADHLAAEARQVFGVDVKYDRQGKPIEQGIGSAAQPSRNSIEAYKTFMLSRRGGPEAGFEEHLSAMEAALAAYETKQRAAKARV